MPLLYLFSIVTPLIVGQVLFLSPCVTPLIVGQVFLPVLRFPLSVSFHQPSHSSASLYHCYQKDERAKPGTLPESIAVSGVALHVCVCVCIYIYIYIYTATF